MMPKFIKVKSYHRGYTNPPEDYVLNVSQIVAFCQCRFKVGDGDESSYLHLDTTQQRGMSIAGTLEELLALIEGKEGA